MVMSDVIHLVQPIGDALVLKADDILEANKGSFESLVIVGRQPDGDICVAGTHGAGDSVLLLEWAKAFLVQNLCTRA